MDGGARNALIHLVERGGERAELASGPSVAEIILSGHWVFDQVAPEGHIPLLVASSLGL
jgi:hypothetical protein